MGTSRLLQRQQATTTTEDQVPMPPKKAKPKALSPEELEELELCWYKFDQQAREFLDVTEFKALWAAVKGPEAYDEDEAKALFEKWDAEKEKKARYGVFMKEMEAEIKSVGDPTLRGELFGRLVQGPAPGMVEYIEKHELSPEEKVALNGLNGLQHLIKAEEIEEMKAMKNPPPGVPEVCYGAMCLLANPGDEVVWKECQTWLRDPELQYFRLFSFFKRVDTGQIDDRRVDRCRKFILAQRDWFDPSIWKPPPVDPNAPPVDPKAEKPPGENAVKVAGIIAMWTLLAVRYFDAVDAYKTLPIKAAGSRQDEGSDKLFSTVMPVRTGLPKAEEAYLAGRQVVLVDPKGVAKQSLQAANAVFLDAKDSSQLRKKHVREMLTECVERGVPLVVGLVDLINIEQCDVVQAFERVAPGLYNNVLNGKIRDPTFFQSFKSDLEAQPAPAGFAFYVHQETMELPPWVTPEMGTPIRIE